MDFKPVKRWSGFALRSVGRHPVIATLSALVLAPVAALAFMGSPAQYRSAGALEVRGDPPSRAILTGTVSDRDPDEDLANAPSAILRDSSIEAILDEAGLVERVHVGEPMFARMRRQLKEAIRGAPSEAAIRSDVENLLRANLLVVADLEANTLRVSADWTNPEDAQRIAELAQETFLEDRRQSEIGPITDSLEIIRGYQERNEKLIADLRDDLSVDEVNAELPPGSPLLEAYNEQARLSQQATAAQQQLDAAELAFDYRYQQIAPPALPTRPASSGSMSILIALLAVALGVIAICFLIDIVRGRIDERWQVERFGVADLGVLRTRATADASA